MKKIIYLVLALLMVTSALAVSSDFRFGSTRAYLKGGKLNLQATLIDNSGSSDGLLKVYCTHNGTKSLIFEKEYDLVNSAKGKQFSLNERIVTSDCVKNDIVNYVVGDFESRDVKVVKKHGKNTPAPVIELPPVDDGDDSGNDDVDDTPVDCHKGNKGKGNDNGKHKGQCKP